MNHTELYQLRETYNRERILLCFNGPFSQGLIEEIGSALRSYLKNEDTANSSALDVFAVYVELAQNIREYSARQNYNEMQASAIIVIARDEDGCYEISAGNLVKVAEGEALLKRVEELEKLDKDALKALYKQTLRAPRESDGSVGLGLIDIARKARVPVSCRLHPIEGDHGFFSLRVVI